MNLIDREQDSGGVGGSSEGERTKPKLAVIRASLKRPDIYVPKEYGEGEDGEVVENQTEYDIVHQVVDIFVAPTEPIFDPEKLNTFMDGLVGGIEPNFRRAADQGDGTFGLGVLVFNETFTRIITTVNSDVGQSEGARIIAGRTPGKVSQTLTREIRLRVYPDPITAFLVYDYAKAKNEGRLESSSLEFDSARYHFLTTEQVDGAKAVYRRKPNFDRKSLPVGS